MKKTVFGIFAHPDDEAFGPSGTMAILARDNDVHVVCVTDGDSDPKFHPQGGKGLGTVRKEELKASAKQLGIRNVHFLGYPDGTLRNNIYHDIARSLQELVDRYRPSLLLTYELRGVSGYLDHVATSMVTSYVYRQTPSVSAIWYFAISRKLSNDDRDYFVYFPPGFSRNEVDRIVDVSEVYEKKTAAARCHRSQREDADFVISQWEKNPKEEWFFTQSRQSDIISGIMV